MTRKCHLPIELTGNLLLWICFSVLSSGYKSLQDTAIDKNLLLKGESPLVFYIILNTYDLAVTVSLSIQKILQSAVSFLYKLCHLRGYLHALLTQSVGCRNKQNSKYILDLLNVLTSSKFMVMNLVKESFHLPQGYRPNS